MSRGSSRRSQRILPLPEDFEPDTRDLDGLKEDLVAMMEEAYEAKEAELGEREHAPTRTARHAAGH